MSKYKSTRRKETPKNNQPHHLWRGIGCLMMIIIPVIAGASAYELVNYGFTQGWPIPSYLLGTPRYPDLFYSSSGMMILLRPITAIKHFYAYAVIGTLLSILLGGIISLGYAIIYRIVGPSQYGPLDAPPPDVKTRPYKR